MLLGGIWKRTEWKPNFVRKELVENEVIKKLGLLKYQPSHEETEKNENATKIYVLSVKDRVAEIQRNCVQYLLILP